MDKQVISVSEFVALVNQTLEFAYPVVRIEGEVSEFRVSKNRWVYFRLKDENSAVRMFGTVYQLQQPIEDGMRVVVKGTPRLHNKYGFSLNISSIVPSGEGSIKRAYELLKLKLEKEGLFASERKRTLPAMPTRIGLITSFQAAAYQDFIKIINERWTGLEILHADVQVQGEPAAKQICGAIDYFSQMEKPVDILVITRGGGGAEDLMVFNSEAVTRAIAGSRVPTIVGVGHEIDVSLADLVADVRATTPTNAAQIAVPNRQDFILRIDSMFEQISYTMTSSMNNRLNSLWQNLVANVTDNLSQKNILVDRLSQTLDLLNPTNLLKRGYALVSDDSGKAVSSTKALKKGDQLMIRFMKGKAKTEVVDVE